MYVKHTNNPFDVQGFYFMTELIKIEDEGSQAGFYFDDIRAIQRNSGHVDTYDFASVYANFEVYEVLTREISVMLFFGYITITVVILMITANLFMTLMILLLITLVLIYLTGLCYFWGLTMNNFFAVNLSLALGISVDYSVHIAHKYLTVIPPATMVTNK